MDRSARVAEDALAAVVGSRALVVAAVVGSRVAVVAGAVVDRFAIRGAPGWAVRSVVNRKELRENAQVRHSRVPRRIRRVPQCQDFRRVQVHSVRDFPMDPVAQRGAVPARGRRGARMQTGVVRKAVRREFPQRLTSSRA